MSTTTPLKGMTEIEGNTAFELLKEKIDEENCVLCEPTNDMKTKKGSVWSAKDEDKLTTDFVEKNHSNN